MPVSAGARRCKMSWYREGRMEPLAHSDDADHRFRQADRRFQAMPITVEEGRSIGALGVGVEG